MSYIVRHPATPETPAEYDSNNPDHCVVCGKLIDLDDDKYVQDVDYKGKKGIACEDCKWQALNHTFGEALKTQRIPERLMAMRTNPSLVTLDAIYNEIGDAAKLDNGEHLDTNQVNEVLGNIEDALYALENAASGVYDQYLEKTIQAVEAVTK